ncbi:hypothetical protein AZC_4047 [Azorhizobium caulinodans ORS 571]|uniref:Argininosuccinate lyase n=2 Tax=Xanthobacteraceae TaxID=335928 RepID=A8ILK8_AZOC5|nr:hypothetical protein AZC_4047 [Azorhizobium caulinodans ORS 571]
MGTAIGPVALRGRLRMVSRICAAVLALFTVLAVSGPLAAAEARQNFTLVNKTGYDIEKVFVSPSKSDDWEEDVLGKDTLDDGDSWEIKFHRATKTCKWDLKVVYSDDNSSAIWYDIDLCSVSKITIRYNRKSDKTTASFD